MSQKILEDLSGITAIRESGKGTWSLDYYDKVIRGELPFPTKDGYTWYHIGFGQDVQSYSLSHVYPNVFTIVQVQGMWCLGTGIMPCNATKLRKLAPIDVDITEIVRIANSFVYKALNSIDLNSL